MMLNNQVGINASVATSNVRAAYCTPKLRDYGDVRSLTEGGSGGTVETGMMGVGGCGTNLSMDCPLI